MAHEVSLAFNMSHLRIDKKFLFLYKISYGEPIFRSPNPELCSNNENATLTPVQEIHLKFEVWPTASRLWPLELLVLKNQELFKGLSCDISHAYPDLKTSGSSCKKVTGCAPELVQG